MVAFLIIWLLLSVAGGSRAGYVLWHKHLLSDGLNRTAILITALVLTSVSFLGGIALIDAVFNYYPDRNFSTTQWIKHPDSRYELVDDLLTSGKLYRVTKPQAATLLGSPDVGNDGDAWIYELGTEPGELTTSAPDVLVIHFDSSRAVSHEVIRPR
jgi:hypothetical protein